jgi:general secretion pathway protein D
VLGGLMSDTVTESEDRVPVLGAIPLLGNLFKSRSGSRQKKNLLVFIRPKILRDADATESVSESKYNDVRHSEQTLNKGKITLLPGERQPSIPAIPQGLPQAPPASITNPQGATPNPPATMPQAFPIVPPTTPTPILPMPGTRGSSTEGAGDKTASPATSPPATAPPAASPAPGTSP